MRGTSRRLLRVGSAVLVGMLVLAACGGEEPAPEPEPEPVEEPEPESAEASEPAPVEEEPDPEQATGPTSFLTGKQVEEQILERPLLIVKIENSPQSRPQTGLEAADVVIEETVEAGVTRFLALFHSRIPDDVGPTRSARPVDAQLIAGYGRSGFIYSGARSEVQGMLSNTPAIRIAEGGPGFHRLSSRRAPHNLYNRLPQAMDAVTSREPDILTDVGWVFDEEPPSGEETCPDQAQGCTDPGEEVQIAMSSSFRTGWEYDADAGLYRRFQNGEPFTVTGEDRIGAANVLVLATRHYLGEPNCHGARCPETDAVTDGADAVVLRDGKRYRATWRKPTPNSDIEVFTADGEPFPFKPGPTWVHLPDASNLPSPVGDGS